MTNKPVERMRLKTRKEMRVFFDLAETERLIISDTAQNIGFTSESVT